MGGSSRHNDSTGSTEIVGDTVRDNYKWITSYVIVPLATTAVTFSVWLYYYNRRRRRRRRTLQQQPVLSEEGKLPRRASFTSLGLALGTFPVEANVPEAIINAACYFGSNDLPSIDDILTEIVQPLLTKYERMSLVLDMTTGYFIPTTSIYEAKDLIRIIQVHGCLDDHGVNEMIFQHHTDSFIQYGTSRPWWEILVIDNNNSNSNQAKAGTTGSTACGPSALVIRVHHTLADGLSLVHAFAPLLKKTTTTTSATTTPTTDSCSSKVVEPTKEPIVNNIRSRNKQSIFKQIYSILEGTIHVLTLGMTRYDHDTLFSKCNHGRMKFSGQRDFVMLPTISLQFIKQLKTAANCTVNTIIMTAMSQAIYDYCVSQNDPILSDIGKSVQCRALLPVGFPRTKIEISDPQTALVNKWCMISCEMFIGYDDILHRLQNIHDSMAQMKDSSRAMMQLFIQNLLVPLLPRNLARQAVMDVFTRHSLVLTNVPGHDTICTLAGKSVIGVQLFFSNMLTQVDILSYANNVFGNIVYDPVALPNFQNFNVLYAKALVHLAERLNIEPPEDLLLFITKG